MVLQSISCRLFIGDVIGAQDLNGLQQSNIKAIVTCGPMSIKWCHHDGKQSNVYNKGNHSFNINVIELNQ